MLVAEGPSLGAAFGGLRACAQPQEALDLFGLPARWQNYLVGSGIPVEPPGVSTAVLECLFTYEDTYVWPKTKLRLFPELGRSTYRIHLFLVITKEPHLLLHAPR